NVGGDVVDAEVGGFFVLDSGGPVNIALKDFSSNNTTGFGGPVFSAVQVSRIAAGNVTVSAGTVHADGFGLAAIDTRAGDVNLSALDVVSGSTSLAANLTNGNVTMTARDLTSTGSPGIVAVNTAGNVTATVRDASGDGAGISVSNTTIGNVSITARNVTARRLIPGQVPGFASGDAIFLSNNSGTATLDLTG
ncbi:MAG: hypothetical protein KDJ77_18930, partial [Rhodobiaceae bacterium]|nr:hypothetical protein [Rhodobiaceae bacterium]